MKEPGDGLSAKLAALRSRLRPDSGAAAVDVSLWLGPYPFRHTPGSTLDTLRQQMRDLRIEHGVICGLDAVFAENNLDAYVPLAERLHADASLEVWPVVRPGALHGLERLLDRFQPRGLRLLPNYHGYRLHDRSVEWLMDLARRRGMIVQVFQRIADERWHWMLKVPPVDPGELDYLASRFDQQPLLVSALNAPQSLKARLAQCAQLHFDLSRVRGPQFAIAALIDSLPLDRLVFGSLWPIQIIAATLWQVTTADIPEASRSAILRENALRLLSLGAPAPGARP